MNKLMVAVAVAGIVAFGAKAETERPDLGDSGSWKDGAVSWSGATKAYEYGTDLILVFQDATAAAKSFTLAAESKAWVLSVAGGGGGSAGDWTYTDSRAAGGGAGGMIDKLGETLAAGDYAVTVGAGGAAKQNGKNSYLTFEEGKLYEAIGGGASSDWNVKGNAGGSGGGGSYSGGGGAGTAEQGFAGGNGNWGHGAGGGGAGGRGADGSNGAAGGPGRASIITGERVVYAGGGAGQICATAADGGGGKGPGGYRGKGGNGVDGLGGGGAGGCNQDGGGGKGGSGVVIVRVLGGGKIAVPKPVAFEGLVYTGKELTGVGEGPGYMLTDNVKTAAGDYTAKAVLDEGYAWEDGSTDELDIPWTIAKATTVWKTTPALSKTMWAVNGKVAVLTAGVANFGEVVATISKDGGASEPFTGALPMTPGEYVLTYAVSESDNWKALSTELSFTVTEAVWDYNQDGVMANGAESVTQLGGDTLIVFKNADSAAETVFAVAEDAKAWILCVGGGGGGGTGANVGGNNPRGGGGGAGGMVETNGLELAAGTYYVTVGAGGANKANGKDSLVATDKLDLLRAVGGGYGGNWGSEVGKAGGCGGGGCLNPGGAGTAGQGYAGGTGTDYHGGGGGGAGEAGHAGNAAQDPSKGGNGKSSTITGTPVYYAGGGNGGSCQAEVLGGGGKAINGAGTSACNGENGKGGGGGSCVGGTSGKGGSGVVIVRVLGGGPILTPKPTAITGLSYTGKEQFGVLPGTGYTLTDNAKTAAGDYVATAKLDDGYAWDDESTDDLDIPWTIAKAMTVWTTTPALSKTTWAVNGKVAVLTSGVPKFGEAVATISKDGGASEPFTGALPMTPGEYVLTYAVAESDDWKALSKDLPFTVTDAVWPIRKRGVKMLGGELTKLSDNSLLLAFSNAASAAECAFEVAPNTKAWILCVGGGGSGGSAANNEARGGGGGAGGFVETNFVRLAGGTYKVTVGAGGSNKADGGDSVIAFAGEDVFRAIGGGHGGNWSQENGAKGGSGGGGSMNPGGAGTPGQGYAGGTGIQGCGAGGGGAGEAGHAGDAAENPGKGGDGKQSTITGTPVYYAGGGCGGKCTMDQTAMGGGGKAVAGSLTAACNGVDGLGGGGGACISGNSKGGNGVVFVRILSMPGTAVIVR